LQITAIDTFHYEYELETPISDARNTLTHRSAVLVRVSTDEGVVGWGEAASFAGCGSLVTATIDFLAERLIGRDPTLPVAIYDELYHGTQHFGRRGLLINALSGIDVALWDIVGKVAGMPLYKILGGKREAINGYYNAGYYTDDHREFLKASVRRAVEAGSKAIKIKIGRYGFEDDAWRIRTARELLGPTRDFMVDANACLEPRYLQRLDDVMVDEGVRWVEEPVPLQPIEALVELRDALRTPVAGYELEMTVDGWQPLIAQRAIDIAQPDTIWSGGITETRRIGELAAAHAIEFVPHNFATIVALAANAHVAAVAPTGGWLEVDSNVNPFLWDLQSESHLSFENGLIMLPQAAGLGVTPNLESVEHLRVK